ncbi:MAG: polysaccharide export protein EpsE [Rhodocyclaceae bacterium]|nr:MAG: polysaccharide export protein EpsE [Rhodocyclaceae bacterium]
MLVRIAARLLASLLCFLFLAGGANADESEYVLGAGDIVRITVFQNPDLTVDTRVSETGMITYPLVGAVPLGGLTIGAAEQKIAQMLRDGGFVQQPQVNILVQQVRGNQVAVLGQVGRPGRFPLEQANSKISDLLALAGGINPGGSDVLILIGQRDGKPYRLELDVASMFLDNQPEQDVQVRGGDIIYVHRAPLVYVYGEVQHPGAFRIERQMTVRQALVLGGGATLRGTLRGVRLYRRNKDGKMEKLEPDLDDPVNSDDVIYVRESLL